MLILALETSGFGGSIALLDDDVVVGERVLDAQRRHAQTLVPEIQSLLREHGKTPQDCQLLAVSIGPGSFTGLRVGITCAKTMAYATGAKIAAVPTFHCLAAGSPQGVDRVQIIMNAQRQELFVGRYAVSGDGTWQETQPLRIERAADWQASLQPTDVVVGPGLEGIAQEVAPLCHLPEPAFWQPTARWVGRLGLRQFHQDNLTTGWELNPLYIRKSAAEEKWDARHGSSDSK